MMNFPTKTTPDYSWAEYLDCMEGGSDVVSVRPPRQEGVREHHALPGFLLAAGLTVVAVGVSGLPVWAFPMDAVMVAIILGMVLGNLWTLPKRFIPGIKFGLIGMFLLPVLGAMMQLSEKAFGAWAGLSIHQTPQVVAAGFAYGNEAGETATIVKLARVCLLVPVVFFIGWFHRRGEVRVAGPGRRVNYLHLFPMFVFGFLGMALLRTLGLLPDLTFTEATVLGDGEVQVTLTKVFAAISQYCIIISMAAVGLETKFSAMKRIGLKPLMASLLAAVLIAVMTLTLIRMLGIR